MIKRSCEDIGEQLYEALKAVQIALYLGEDEDDKQIETALQAWERKNLYTGP